MRADVGSGALEAFGGVVFSCSLSSGLIVFNSVEIESGTVWSVEADEEMEH